MILNLRTCTTCMQVPVKTRILGALELGLQVIICHMYSSNQIRILSARAASGLNCCAISLIPRFFLFILNIRPVLSNSVSR